jgi:hypothetical protein
MTDLTPAMLRCMHRPATLKQPVAKAKDCQRLEPRMPVESSEGHFRDDTAEAPTAQINAKEPKYDDCPDPQLPNAVHGQQAPALAGDHAREAPSTRCPIVRYTLFRVRLLDVDAKFASVKDTLDGLRYAGLIRGDKEGEITLEVEQTKVKTFKEERTLIEIVYPE